MNTPKQAVVKIIAIGVGTLAINIIARVAISKIAANVDYSVN
jgi:hypothetical protein